MQATQKRCVNISRLLSFLDFKFETCGPIHILIQTLFMKFSIFFRYVGLLLVGLMAGSSFSFLVGMGSGLERLPVGSKFELHKSMEFPFAQWTYVIYLALILILCFNLFSIRQKWKTLEFILVVFSLVCVVDDLVMTLVGDLPLIESIQSWLSTSPGNWIEVRSQWLNFMYIRCALLISSFILLLASSYLMDRPKASRKGVFAAA